MKPPFKKPWTRIYRFKCKRNWEHASILVEDFVGAVGASMTLGIDHTIKLRFFKHADWCDGPCGNRPTFNFKQYLRWLRRRTR